MLALQLAGETLHYEVWQALFIGEVTSGMHVDDGDDVSLLEGAGHHNLAVTKKSKEKHIPSRCYYSTISVWW